MDLRPIIRAVLLRLEQEFPDQFEFGGILEDQPLLVDSGILPFAQDYCRWQLCTELYIGSSGIPIVIAEVEHDHAAARHEVLGEMLEYLSWLNRPGSAESVLGAMTTNLFERLGSRTDGVGKSRDYAEQVSQLADALRNSLKQGKATIVIVSTEPTQVLRAVVDYLNRSKSAARVFLACGPLYTVGLNPQQITVYGSKKPKKGGRNSVGVGSRTWDWTLFLKTLEGTAGDSATTAAIHFRSWAESKGLSMSWGTGSLVGTVSICTESVGSVQKLARLTTTGDWLIWKPQTVFQGGIVTTNKLPKIPENLHIVSGLKNEKRMTFTVNSAQLLESRTLSVLIDYLENILELIGNPLDQT